MTKESSPPPTSSNSPFTQLPARPTTRSSKVRRLVGPPIRKTPHQLRRPPDPAPRCPCSPRWHPLFRLLAPEGCPQGIRRGALRERRSDRRWGRRAAYLLAD